MKIEEINKKVMEAMEKTERAITRYAKMLTPETAEGSVGRVSRMNASTNKTIGYDQLSVAKARLVSLKLVQSKIGSEEFGICINCQKPIALGRILARPESLRCVKCAI